MTLEEATGLVRDLGKEPTKAEIRAVLARFKEDPPPRVEDLAEALIVQLQTAR